MEETPICASVEQDLQLSVDELTSTPVKPLAPEDPEPVPEPRPASG